MGTGVHCKKMPCLTLALFERSEGDGLSDADDSRKRIIIPGGVD
jgi:hypothetical protein